MIDFIYHDDGCALDGIIRPEPRPYDHDTDADAVDLGVVDLGQWSRYWPEQKPVGQVNHHACPRQPCSGAPANFGDTFYIGNWTLP